MHSRKHASCRAAAHRRQKCQCTGKDTKMSPGLALANRKQQSRTAIAGFFSPPASFLLHIQHSPCLSPPRQPQSQALPFTHSDIVCHVATAIGQPSARCQQVVCYRAANQTHQVPEHTAVHCRNKLSPAARR